MKLTAKQHRNIANGIERIKKQAERATIFLFCHYTNGHGSYFSDKFKK